MAAAACCGSLAADRSVLPFDVSSWTCRAAQRLSSAGGRLSAPPPDVSKAGRPDKSETQISVMMTISNPAVAILSMALLHSDEATHSRVRFATTTVV